MTAGSQKMSLKKENDLNNELRNLKKYTLKTEQKLERVFKEMKKYRDQVREQEKEMN